MDRHAALVALLGATRHHVVVERTISVHAISRGDDRSMCCLCGNEAHLQL